METLFCQYQIFWVTLRYLLFVLFVYKWRQIRKGLKYNARSWTRTLYVPIFCSNSGVTVRILRKYFDWVFNQKSILLRKLPEQSWTLKVLESDKLSEYGQTCQVWPYLNSKVKIKLPFSQQEHLQISPTSLTKWIIRASLWFRVRETQKSFSIISVM